MAVLGEEKQKKIPALAKKGRMGSSLWSCMREWQCIEGGMMRANGEVISDGDGTEEEDGLGLKKLDRHYEIF